MALQQTRSMFSSDALLALGTTVFAGSLWGVAEFKSLALLCFAILFGDLRGATWGSQGTIAFSPGVVSALQQVSDAGGIPEPLTHFEKGDVSHRWPEYLPGGKAVLFAAAPTGVNLTNAQVAVQSETGERRNLVQGGMPRYAPSGHLVYAQGGNLMAVPFDPQRLTITGTTVPVAEGVLQSPINGHAHYSFSSTGSLVYISGGDQATQVQLVWVSRNGGPLTISLLFRAADVNQA